MMYKHMIDECLERAREELAVVRKYHREEEIEHIQRRIDSLLRLRENAPKARHHIPVPVSEIKREPKMDYEEYFKTMIDIPL